MLTLYNTLTREKEPFHPLEPDKVGLYVCGNTVYDYAHVGNARPVVVFDLLYRWLKHHYKSVRYVRNFTDIDDKIIARALENNEKISDLTERMIGYFREDMASLGVIEPDFCPKATETIPEMIALIAELISKNFAYVAEKHVLFHVPSYESYGKLSRHSMDELMAGARVETAPYKKHPADFVLWKPSEGEAPGWDSPWGYGRPGWHIECSAMSGKLLGSTFDIHGGGIDLVFPHHENEIAQSCSAHGTPEMARYWLHNGMVQVNGQKMSKSLGNYFTVREVLASYPAEAIRLTLLSSHYRQPLDFNARTIDQSLKILDRLYGAFEEEHAVSGEPALIDSEVAEALDDDLNTPLAIQRLVHLTHEIHKSDGSAKRERQESLLASARVMGFLAQTAVQWFQRPQGVTLLIGPEEIANFIQRRAAARDKKDFAQADAIRAELASAGILLKDSPEGATWRRLHGGNS